MRSQLTSIDGVHLTDDGAEKCGIVTFTTDQLNPLSIKHALAKSQINVSTSKGSGSLVSFRERGLKEVVRASVHYFNTLEEVDYFINSLQKVITK